MHRCDIRLSVKRQGKGSTNIIKMNFDTGKGVKEKREPNFIMANITDKKLID